MGKIAVLPKDNSCLTASQDYLSDKPMPAFYMGDYSIMGLLVEKFEEAVRLLIQRGYAIKQKKSGIEIELVNPVHIKHIFELLDDHHIKFDMRDIVAQVYQG